MCFWVLILLRWSHLLSCQETQFCQQASWTRAYLASKLLKYSSSVSCFSPTFNQPRRVMLSRTKCWWIRNAGVATYGLISWVLEVKSQIGFDTSDISSPKYLTPLMTFKITVKLTDCLQKSVTHTTSQYRLLASACVGGWCESVCSDWVLTATLPKRQCVTSDR